MNEPIIKTWLTPKPNTASAMNAKVNQMNLIVALTTTPKKEI